MISSLMTHVLEGLTAIALMWWVTSPMRYEHNRAYDLKILWPIMKEKAKDLTQARYGFIIHMGNDPAWRALEDGWTEEEFNDWVERTLV